MKHRSRTIGLMIAGTLVASTAQGQFAGTPLPNGTIGVQFEFVPFSLAPRRAPELSFLGPTQGGLTCPMPVLRGDSSADTEILVTPVPTAAEWMFEEESPATGCRNPLFHPPMTRIFVW